jgi:dihydrodipicolinate synthase/N-acetylneuraminate lyase
MSGTIHGIIPPMTTPFDADGAIDEGTVRTQEQVLPDREVTHVEGLVEGRTLE